MSSKRAVFRDLYLAVSRVLAGREAKLGLVEKGKVVKLGDETLVTELSSQILTEGMSHTKKHVHIGKTNGLCVNPRGNDEKLLSDITNADITLHSNI